MRQKHKISLVALAAALTFAIAIPVLGQDKPESILPPGFGDPTPEPPSPPTSRPSGSDDQPARPSSTSSGDSGSNRPRPRSAHAPKPRPSSSTSSSGGFDLGESGKPQKLTKPGEEGDLADGEGTTAPVFMDIPPQARRSTAVVGVLDPSDGDMGLTAFQGFNGRYLSTLMRRTKAPLVSRWGSIILRRALLSRAYTPTDVSGADWAAERAWLLLRMGEADPARLLVQSVDVDQYTPKMFDVAMQSSLANADPAGICHMNEWVDKANKETEWTISRGICSALAGESGLANAQLDRARDRKTPEIDMLLAEKVVGATRNTRRAVQVQWEDVKQLTAWRFGLATATGMEIPPKLLNSVGPHVQAWRAKAPLLSLESRLGSAERATSLGVFSNAAIVDFYGGLYDSLDPSARSGSPSNQLRLAYSANTVASRLAALKALWKVPTEAPWLHYARFVTTAAASARVPVSDELAEDSGDLVASMLAAGLDVRATKWTKVAESSAGIKAWGLLAVGSPEPIDGVTSGKISSFGSTSQDAATLKGQMLFAALAGLGRIDADEVESMAKSYDVPIGRSSKWTKAIKQAAIAQAPGAVAILSAVGLQARNWRDVSPTHLYHVVAALKKVGLEGEARMIAVEALTRVG
jgi:hypothetical protein